MNIDKYEIGVFIEALRQCAEEHKNEITYTGYIRTKDLCNDTAKLLEKILREYEKGKMNEADN